MGKYSQERKPYPSDVTDEEWAHLEPLIPAAKPGRRPQEIDQRELLNTILYVLRSGCLTHASTRFATVVHSLLVFPPMETGRGIWEQVNAALRRDLRVQMGREPEPSAAILDSQSTKSSAVCGDTRGFDGGKKSEAENGACWWTPRDY